MEQGEDLLCVSDKIKPKQTQKQLYELLVSEGREVGLIGPQEKIHAPSLEFNCI